MDELPEGATIDWSSAMNSGQFAANRFPGQSVVLALVFVLAFYGLFLVGAKIFSFIRLLFSLFVLPGVPVSSNLLSHAHPPSLTPANANPHHQLRKFGPPGSWAVITGASDGIGKEFALQLARQNFSVLLISRTASKLETLAEEINSEYGPSGVQTLTHAMDFASPTPSDYSHLKTLIVPLDVSILINNVGKSHSIPVPFAQTPSDEMLDIIRINCEATLSITQLVLPGMLQRKRGLVLTMGSFGGLLPTPLLATYSGSKAFLATWSRALGSELSPHGITVELVNSYLVTSAMSKIRRASVLVPTPRAFVRSVLGKVGRSGGAQGAGWASTPYWSHGLMQWGLERVVGVRGKRVVDWNRGMHERIRGRALRKREREEGEGRKEL